MKAFFEGARAVIEYEIMKRGGIGGDDARLLLADAMQMLQVGREFCAFQGALRLRGLEESVCFPTVQTECLTHLSVCELTGAISLRHECLQSLARQFGCAAAQRPHQIVRQ